MSNNADYDELVGKAPGLAPVAANEEPTGEEQMQYDNLFADFMDVLYGKGEEATKKILQGPGEPYDTIAKTAFTMLKSVVAAYQHERGEIESAVLFGEGGIIHTAVDEIYKRAQAWKIPGVENMDQYAAAQINMMRLVGEYMEQKQDDEGVSEAQEALMDMEEQGNPGGMGDVPPMTGSEKASLRSASAHMPPEQGPEAAAAPPETMPPEEVAVPPAPIEEEAMPQGLV
jgi:hypothetical protein